MTEPRVTPMIHVPDVGAAVDWYTGIGFTVLRTGEEDGEPVWALLAFGSGRVMLNAGGRSSDAERREVDLYVETPGVDDLYRTLQARVVTVEEPHDTFYGMREFIIRDLNGFWITFGEERARSPPMTDARRETNLKDGDSCRVVQGSHAGKSGTVRDINTSQSGHVTITVVQTDGERFKTLARNVEVTGGT